MALTLLNVAVGLALAVALWQIQAPLVVIFLIGIAYQEIVGVF